MSHSWKALAPKVLALAEGARMQQKRLASQLGVSPSTLSLWLTGRRTPRFDKAMRLVAAVGGSWSNLLGEQPTRSAIADGDVAPYGSGDEILRFPLVAEKVAAGFGSVPQETEPVYYLFRSKWRALKSPKDERRYRMARLGREADSMEPDIHASSILLFDLYEESRVSPEWGTPYLCVVDRRTSEVALKNVEPLRDGGKVRGVVLVSNNRAYRPVTMPFERGERIQDLVRAKLVWHGTEW